MTMSTPYNRLDLDQAVVLLLDHQAGLMFLVCDIEPDKFRNNVLAVADLAAYFQLPTILTTSFEEGPNGPIMPELKAKFPNAPFIARPGQINAWDNSDFLAAVKAEVTVLLTIKRDGSLLGQPRITHSRLLGGESSQKDYLASVLGALASCFPRQITDGLGGAIAGRPLRYRIVSGVLGA
jgi:hypothetical protein